MNRLIRQCGIAPPPTISLHRLGRRDKSIGDFPEVRVGQIMTEDKPSRSDPAQRQAFCPQVVLKHPVVPARLCVNRGPDGCEVHHPNR